MQTFALQFLVLFLTFSLSGADALAQKRNDPGVTDTEIKIGQTMPYSGAMHSTGSEDGAVIMLIYSPTPA